MPDVHIRLARDDELDIVASLIVDAYAEYAAAMSPDAWSMYAQDIANVHGRRTDADLVVAERDGRLVGALTMYTRWRGAQADSVAVRLFAVPPKERGSGVGKALMTWCADWARSHGKRRLVVTTTQEMAVMRELTERMGFERAPELDHEPAPGVRVEGYALTVS
jgi:GNAT superfamily N-acetyltransferase